MQLNSAMPNLRSTLVSGHETSRPHARVTHHARAVTLILLSLLIAFGIPQASSATQPTDVASEHIAPDGEIQPPPTPINVRALIAQDGTLRVVETFDWDVSAVKPPFLRALPLFVPRTDAVWRKFEYSDFKVTSETADFTVSMLDDSHQLLASITQVEAAESLDSEAAASSVAQDSEAPEHTVHTVKFTYKVRGATSFLSPGNNDLDELFWAPLASGGTERNELTFSVTADGKPISLSCNVILDDRNLLGWASALDNAESDPLPDDVAASEASCSPNRNKGTVVASQLNRLSTVIVNATYPNGTVKSHSAVSVTEPDKSPAGEDVPSSDAQFDPTWSENIDFGLDQGMGLLMPIGAGVGSTALLVVLWFLFRSRPDYTFPGLAPGDVAGARERSLVIPEVEKTAKRKTLNGAIKAPQRIEAGTTTSDLETLPIELYGAITHLILSPQQILAMLVSLAQRGHLHISQISKDAEQKSTDKPLIFWRLTLLPSTDPLTPIEQTLIKDLFRDTTEAEAHTLHSAFAPQFLEILTLIGQASQSQGLTVEPVGHASVSSARRTQRTPVGRAFAEQIEALRCDYLSRPQAITVQDIPALIALGSPSVWHTATVDVPLPDTIEWLDTLPSSKPTDISELLIVLHSMLSSSGPSARGI